MASGHRAAPIGPGGVQQEKRPGEGAEHAKRCQNFRRQAKLCQKYHCEQQDEHPAAHLPLGAAHTK